MTRAGVRERRLIIISVVTEAMSSELSGLLGFEFRISPVDGDSLVAWEVEFPSDRAPPEGGWDWEAVDAKCTGTVDHFPLALTVGDRLCGLGLIVFASQTVKIELLEGNPDDTHPAKGKVTAIFLDLADRIAARSERAEIWVVNPAPGLVGWYEGLGFTFEQDGGGNLVGRRPVT